MKAAFLLLACLVAGLSARAVVTFNAETGIEGEFIVVLATNATVEERDALIENLSSKSELLFRYEIKTFIAFAAKLHMADMKVLAVNPLVTLIEQNAKVEVYSECGERPQADWGLCRVSRHADQLENNNDLDTFYFNADSMGQGVTAYIIDTGIRTTHNEFEGRCRATGFPVDGNVEDGNGHGTHVAGTVGGTVYGVASAVTLVPVKVLSDSGSGSTATVIGGLEFSAQDCETDESNNKCVANLSLGGGRSTAMNSAATAASETLTVVVAAGNDNRDASGYSPASAAGVITVGATTRAASQGGADERAYYSNFGADVDIMAPGTMITSAWIGGNTHTNTISGTSMASPHVAGVVAQLLSAGAVRADIPEMIQSTADHGVVTINNRAGTTTDMVQSSSC